MFHLPMCLHKFVKLVTSSGWPCKKLLHWANVCFSEHATSQSCRHTTSETFRKGYANIVYTISNLECCKRARMRFHCANALVVLRSCAP